MEQLLAYIGMALVIAVLVLLDMRKTRPVQEAADRFSLAFWEVREHALSAAPPLPAAEETENGVLLLPDQALSVQAALSAGADELTRERDARMEQDLREMFRCIGKSAHLKRRFFDYCNNLFVLHRTFLKVCADPSAPLTSDEWKDLSLYWLERERMRQLVQERLSPKKRAAMT